VSACALAALELNTDQVWFTGTSVVCRPPREHQLLLHLDGSNTDGQTESSNHKNLVRWSDTSGDDESGPVLGDVVPTVHANPGVEGGRVGTICSLHPTFPH
jgi:hypothetical protein